MLFDFEIIDVVEGEPSGTSLVGYVTEDYVTLVEAFGQPSRQIWGGDKVCVMWELEFTVQEQGEDDTRTVRATIYDWKEDNCTVAMNAPSYKWHIGGDTNDAVDCVNQCIGAVYAV